MMCLFFFLLFICGKKKILWLWEFEVLVTFHEAIEFISLAGLLLIQSYTIHFLAQERVCLVSHDCCLQSLKRIAFWCFCVCFTVIPPIFHWEKEFRMENFICISVKISCFLGWIFFILDGWWTYGLYLRLSESWQTLSLPPQLSSHWLVTATPDAHCCIGCLPVLWLCEAYS